MAVDEEGNDVSRAGKWVKLAVGIATLTVLVGGIIWGMTSTFAFKEEVAKQFLLVEEQTVKTFDQVQKQFTRFGREQDIKFYKRELKGLNERHILIEREINMQPNNNILKEERQRIINNKTIMQQKYDKLLEQ